MTVCAQKAEPTGWVLNQAMALLVNRAYPGVSMDLLALIDGLPVRRVSGDTHVAVTGLCTDSRRVSPGAVFFAMPGTRMHGSAFVDQAVERGAVCVVSEERGGAIGRCAHVEVSDIRGFLACVAQRYFNYAPDLLPLVGVTGTNGKTTVAFLLQYLLSGSRKKKRWGMIGTVHYSMGMRTLPAHRTTPGPIELYGMLEQMRNAGCPGAVMEVSSHGIHQRRIEGLAFRAGAFLNLTRDHIDYHRGMDEYFEVKAGFFEDDALAPETAVVNIDDPYGRNLAGRLAGRGNVVTFGLDSGALIRAEAVELGVRGSRFTVRTPEGVFPVDSPLLGLFNVSNVLAALALGRALGADVGEMASAVGDFQGVPGRMERIDEGQPFNVIVDYAHTDDALRNALAMLRAVTEGRLLVVFGCGGNRDRAKRPLMTRAVLENCDRCWATADNPRKEALSDIFEDMRAGVGDAAHIDFIDDRRRAISLAITEAREGDCVLIAGKGHETYQELADTVLPFDDRAVARELLRLKNLHPGLS